MARFIVKASPVPGHVNPISVIVKKLVERGAQFALAHGIPLVVAGAYLELRDKDKAFEWLEKAYETRDQWLLWLKISPLADLIRTDPRYKAMLKKIGLDD